MLKSLSLEQVTRGTVPYVTGTHSGHSPAPRPPAPPDHDEGTPTMKPTTLDALASLYLHSATRGTRAPRRFTLDDHGTPVRVTVPAPASLAEVDGLLPGAESGLRRTGTSGLTTQTGEPLAWSLRDLAGRLVERLADLPDRADAGEPYRNLRTLCAVSDRFAPEYALDVVKAWRRTLPRFEQPVEHDPHVRQYPTGETDRKSERRARYRHQEEESARYYFRGWASGWDGEETPPEPGSRAYATQLLTEAVDLLEQLVDAEETVDDQAETPARVPGPRRFYGVGDELLGDRKKTNTGRAYWTVPEEAPVSTTPTADRFAEAVLDRVARLAWEENREGLTAYLEEAVAERDRIFYPATGTDDGAVVDLEQRRRSR